MAHSARSRLDKTQPNRKCTHVYKSKAGAKYKQTESHQVPTTPFPHSPTFPPPLLRFLTNHCLHPQISQLLPWTPSHPFTSARPVPVPCLSASVIPMAYGFRVSEPRYLRRLSRASSKTFTNATQDDQNKSCPSRLNHVVHAMQEGIYDKNPVLTRT